MNHTMKAGRLLWERNYPYIIALLLIIMIGILSHEDLPCQIIMDQLKTKILSENILGAILTVESILFGFLLTVLTLTLQSDATSINEIKRAGRISELISYNKNAVITSFLTIITTTIVMLTHDITTHYLYTAFLYLWGFITLTNLLSTYRFLDIFYALIHK